MSDHTRSSYREAVGEMAIDLRHLSEERDEAREEADRLREALEEIAARCLTMPQVLENYTTRRVLHIARDALDAEEDNR